MLYIPDSGIPADRWSHIENTFYQTNDGGVLTHLTPFTLSWTEEIADLYALIKLYWYPSWNSEARKFATSLIGSEKKLAFLSLHQRFCGIIPE